MRKYRRRPRVLQEKVGEFRRNGQAAREKVTKNTCFEEKVGCNETEHNYGFDRYLASKVTDTQRSTSPSAELSMHEALPHKAHPEFVARPK